MLYKCLAHNKKNCRKTECVLLHLVPLLTAEQKLSRELTVIHKRWMSPFLDMQERRALAVRVKVLTTRRPG